MKKNLLLICGAMAALSVSAEGVQPEVVPSWQITHVSSDGNWIVGENYFAGGMWMYDLRNGVKHELLPAEDDINTIYSPGLGNCVSNNGIVVASTTYDGSDAAYWKDGKWHQLPLAETDKGISLSHGITPDGKRICGIHGAVAMSLDADQIMGLPVVWYMNENGEYGMYTELPYPEIDFSGRLPQYVTAVNICDDGKTVVGQVRDFSGRYNQPIIYRQAADGTWSYELLFSSIFNNPDLTWPEFPGEAPEQPNINDYMDAESLAKYEEALDAYSSYSDKQPKAIDYLTEEEYEAYLAAIDAYSWESGDPYPNMTDFMSDENRAAYESASDEYWANYPDYPSKRDFMTDEQLAAYNAVMEKYDEEFAIWDEAYYAYDEAFYENTADFPTFDFNSVALSANGKYLASTSSVFDWWTWTSTVNPYILNLASGESKNPDMQAAVTYVNDEGATLAYMSNPINNGRYAYISPAFGEEFIPIEEYVKEKNTSLYEWMGKNMVHDINDYVIDEASGNYEPTVTSNVWCTGTPTATPNLDMILTYVDNIFADESEEYYYSYILPLSQTTGICDFNANKELQVKANNGMINIAGHAAKVEVYDLNGRIVFRAENPGATVATGLQNGMYIVKATDAAGQSKVLKAAF